MIRSSIQIKDSQKAIWDSHSNCKSHHSSFLVRNANENLSSETSRPLATLSLAWPLQSLKPCRSLCSPSYSTLKLMRSTCGKSTCSCPVYVFVTLYIVILNNWQPIAGSGWITTISTSGVGRIELNTQAASCTGRVRHHVTFLLLLSFQNKGNAESAIQDFSSIIRLSPDNPDGWIKRAEVQSTCLWKQLIASRSKHVFLLGLPPGKDFNIIMWQLIDVFLTFWEDDLRPTLMFLPWVSQFFCLFSWPPKYTFNLMVFRRKFWNEILPY